MTGKRESFQSSLSPIQEGSKEQEEEEEELLNPDDPQKDKLMSMEADV